MVGFQITQVLKLAIPVQMLNSFLILVFVCFFGGTFAQAKNASTLLSDYGQSLKSAGFGTCGFKSTPEHDAVSKIITQIEKDPRQFKTLEDVLEAFPSGMKTHWISMIKSDSIQKADLEHPRFILRDDYDTVHAAFTTNPELEGHDEIEVIRLKSNQRAQLEFVKIKETRSGVIVDRNSTTCRGCHADHHLTDTYNSWAGQLPFLYDAVVARSPEAPAYRNIIAKIFSKQGRFAYLNTPFVSLNSFDFRLKSQGFVNFGANTTTDASNSVEAAAIAEFAGNATRLHDHAIGMANCRFLTDLNKIPIGPDLDAVAKLIEEYYSGSSLTRLMAGELDTSLIPSIVADRIKNFYGGIYGQGLSVLDYYKKLTFETDQLIQQGQKNKIHDIESVFKRLFKLVAFSADEDTRENILFLSQNFSKTAQQNKQLQSFLSGYHFRGDSLGAIVRVRQFLFLPFGVDLRSYSISQRAANYAIGDFLFPITGVSFLGTYNLQNISRDELAKALVKQIDLNISRTCRANPNCAPITLDGRFVEYEGLSQIEKAQKVFSKHGCVDCHSNSVAGAPRYDLSNLTAFSNDIRTNSRTRGFAHSILPSIRHEAWRAAPMPMFRAPVHPKEIEFVEDYLKTAL